MRLFRRSIASLVLAGATFAGAAVLTSAPTVRAAPTACAGYSVSSCTQLSLPAHAREKLRIKKAKGLSLILKTGAQPAVVDVKIVTKPAGAPGLPHLQGKTASYFTVQVKHGYVHVSASGKGTLYAYSPATNTWKKVGKENVKPGTVYAFVTAKKK